MDNNCKNCIYCKGDICIAYSELTKDVPIPCNEHTTKKEYEESIKTYMREAISKLKALSEKICG